MVWGKCTIAEGALLSAVSDRPLSTQDNLQRTDDMMLGLVAA